MADNEEGKKKPEDGAKTPESRLETLEENVESVKKDVSQILKAINKMQPEEKKPEDKDKKKTDEEEDDKDKKKEEISDNGKTGIGTEEVKPKPEGGEAKLPPATAGETDETAKPAGEEPGSKIEKTDIKKMISEGLKEALEGMNITKSTTPRNTHEQGNTGKKAKVIDPAMDMMKQVREGKMTIADMNRKANDLQKADHDKRLKAVFSEGDE